MKIKLLALLFLTTLISGVNAQNVDEILAKYFENTGGISNWKALQSMKVEGTMNMQGMDLDFNMVTKRPDLQRMQIKVQGMEIVQAYDGQDAWMINPFASGTEPVKMTPEESKEMTDRKFEDEFIDYKSKGHEVTLLGQEEIDGVKCHKIQIIKNKNNDKEDVTEIHYFDTENFVPIMVVSYARSGPMKGSESNTYLSDYQEVNGFMIPFSTETKMNGQSLMKMTFKNVSLNEQIDNSVFAFPKK